MKKLNNSQIKGIAILVLSIFATFLIENSLFQTLGGVLSAIGVSYILKFIPFNIQNLNLKPSKIFRK